MDMKINKTKGFKLYNKKTVIAVTVVCILVGAMFVSTVSAQAKFGDRIKNFVNTVKSRLSNSPQNKVRSTQPENKGFGDSWKNNKDLRTTLLVYGGFLALKRIVKKHPMVAVAAAIAVGSRVKNYVNNHGGNLPDCLNHISDELSMNTDGEEPIGKNWQNPNFDNGNLARLWFWTRFVLPIPTSRVLSTAAIGTVFLMKYTKQKIIDHDGGLPGYLDDLADALRDAGFDTDGED